MDDFGSLRFDESRVERKSLLTKGLKDYYKKRGDIAKRSLPPKK